MELIGIFRNGGIKLQPKSTDVMTQCYQQFFTQTNTAYVLHHNERKKTFRKLILQSSTLFPHTQNKDLVLFQCFQLHADRSTHATVPLPQTHQLCPTQQYGAFGWCCGEAIWAPDAVATWETWWLGARTARKYTHSFSLNWLVKLELTLYGTNFSNTGFDIRRMQLAALSSCCIHTQSQSNSYKVVAAGSRATSDCHICMQKSVCVENGTRGERFNCCCKNVN